MAGQEHKSLLYLTVLHTRQRDSFECQEALFSLVTQNEKVAQKQLLNTRHATKNVSQRN